MATPAQVVEQGISQGFQQGVARKEAKKDQLSDLELQDKITGLIDNRKSIQAKLPTLLDDKGQPTPQYTQAMDDLTKNAQALREVYHPNQNPTAVSRFGHLFTDHLGLTSPLQRSQQETAKKAAGVAQDQKTAQGVAVAAPLPPEQVAAKQYTAQVNAQLGAIDKSGMSDDDKARAKQAIFKIYARPNNVWLDLPDGTTVLGDKNDPDSIPPGARPHLNPTVGNTELSQYNQGIADGTIPAGTSFLAWKGAQTGKMSSGQLLQDSYLATIGLPSGTQWDKLSNAQRSGYELYVNKLKQHFGTRQATITDRDGNVHIVDLSSSSGPSMAASPISAPSAPQGALPQGGSATPPKANTGGGTGAKPTKEGLVLNFKKATPSYTKAQNTYEDTNRISKLADKWIQHPNSEADANFVLALIRSEAGRVNQQEIGQMFNAGGIEELPDRWAAKAEHGELPPELRKQLVDFVHLQKDAAKEVVDEMGGDSGTTPPPTQAGRPKGAIGTVSHGGKNYWVDAQGNNKGVAP
jgi:hypothetical protein